MVQYNGKRQAVSNKQNTIQSKIPTNKKTKPIQKKVQDASLCVEWGKNKIIVSFVKENCASNRNKQAFIKPTKDSIESTIEDFSGNVIDSTSKTFKKYEFKLFNKNLFSMS